MDNVKNIWTTLRIHGRTIRIHGRTIRIHEYIDSFNKNILRNVINSIIIIIIIIIINIPWFVYCNYRVAVTVCIPEM